MGAQIVEPVTLEVCARTCAPVARFSPPSEPPRERLSPDGRHALVIHRDLGAPRWVLETYEVDGPPAHVGTVELADSFDPDRGSTQYLWTPRGAVLITWGAGTFASVGDLYGDGARVLSFTASAHEVSPDRRFLATFAPVGAPRTEPLVVFDLATGATLYRGEATRIASLRWEHAAVGVVTATGFTRVRLAAPR